MNWQDIYRAKIVTFEEAAKKIQSGDWVMFSQAQGEARTLVKAINERKDELEDVKLMTHLHWGIAIMLRPIWKKFSYVSNFLNGTVRDDYA